MFGRRRFTFVEPRNFASVLCINSHRMKIIQRRPILLVIDITFSSWDLLVVTIEGHWLLFLKRGFRSDAPDGVKGGINVRSSRWFGLFVPAIGSVENSPKRLLYSGYLRSQNGDWLDHKFARKRSITTPLPCFIPIKTIEILNIMNFNNNYMICICTPHKG